MTVEVYLGREFQFGHEHRVFGEFLQELIARFEESQDLYLVVGEVEVDAAKIDMLLLGPGAIIIADFKEIRAASTAVAGSVRLRGGETGPWEYILPDGSCHALGGKEKVTNPYEQLAGFHDKFAIWLSRRSSQILGESWSRRRVRHHTFAWAVISPGFDGDHSQLDLPWAHIQDDYGWFDVVPASRLAWRYRCTSHPTFRFSEDQLRRLVVQLDATRCENLAAVLPIYMPSLSGIRFFSPAPKPRGLVDRSPEMTLLRDYLGSSSVPILCLTGPGGTGKTELAAWLAEEAAQQRWGVWWVSCLEREVTGESFLAAVAAKAPNVGLAGLIVDKDRVSLSDRIDAAIGVLQREPTVVILDDFHKASQDVALQELLTHAVRHCEQLKLVLASREYPVCVDRPDWGPGDARVLTVAGLPREAIPEFFANDQPGGLTDDQIAFVWERTSGNPYAMRLVTPLVRKYGWGKRLSTLPLYTAGQAECQAWFASLMEALGENTRRLARRLAVVRTDITPGLIAAMWENSEEAEQLADALVDQRILQPAGASGHLIMYEFVREYLYQQLEEESTPLTKAHDLAAAYYARLAGSSTDRRARADYLAEAIYHLDKAARHDGVLHQAEEAFELLTSFGDWSRAHTIATCALRAAQAKKKQIAAPLWLARVAGWELDQDRVKEAERHLVEALSQLQKVAPRTSKTDRPRVQAMGAQVHLQKGRLAYRISSFPEALSHFDQALARATDAADRRLEAACLMWIGRVERNTGQFDAAQIRFQQAGEVAAALGDDSLVIESTSHLGLLARQRGDREQAHRLFDLAYEKALQTEDRRSQEINLSHKGDLLRRAGEYAEAEKIFRECLRISHEVGSGIGIRISAGQLAECLIHLGCYGEAKTLLDEAEQRCQVVRDGVGLAWCLKRRGEMLKFEGQVDVGNALIQQGIDKLREIGSEVYIPDFETALGPVQRRLPGLDPA